MTKFFIVLFAFIGFVNTAESLTPAPGIMPKDKIKMKPGQRVIVECPLPDTVTPGITPLPEAVKCRSNQKSPHWKEVNGNCLPSCGHAGTLWCQKNSCQGLKLSTSDSVCQSQSPFALIVKAFRSYGGPCCLIRQLKPLKR